MNKLLVLAVCAFLVLGCDNTATNTDASDNSGQSTQNKQANDTSADNNATDNTNNNAVEPVIEEIPDTEEVAKNTQNTTAKATDNVVTLSIEGMTWGVGCAPRVAKILEKCDGVEKVEVDFATKKATVTGKVDGQKLMKALKEDGRYTGTLSN